MHAYKIITMATGLFDESTVQKVNSILKEGLEDDVCCVVKLQNVLQSKVGARVGRLLHV